jgi:hypothetical protein
MYKRGQVGELLIILLVLGGVGGALLAMLSFDKDLDNQSEEISMMLEEIEFSEKYIVMSAGLIGMDVISFGARDLVKEYMSVANERDLRLGIGGNFFGKIRSGEFRFEKIGDEYVLDLEGVVIESEFGRNKIARDFNLVIVFDNGGEIKDTFINKK